MKFSFMSFSCPDLSLEDMLELVKTYGYDGVEPRISANHKHGIEFDATAQEREQARRKAEESGVPYACVATSCRYADPETSAAMIGDTHKAIDLAADIGCPRIRVFGGAFPDSMEREDAIALVVRSLQSVSEHAAEREVTVCMETHDAWCNPAHVAEVIGAVNHPRIAVNWDIMHPVRVAGVSVDESFRILEPWIRHIHFHDGIQQDGKLTMVPIGEGQIDHRKAVELMQSIDYDGFMSGEWINWQPYDEHLPREIETMRRYENEARGGA